MTGKEIDVSRNKNIFGTRLVPFFGKKYCCVREPRAHNKEPPIEFSAPPSISATMAFSPKGKGKSRYSTGIATWVRYKVDRSCKRRGAEEKGDLKRERCGQEQKYIWDKRVPNGGKIKYSVREARARYQEPPME